MRPGAPSLSYRNACLLMAGVNLARGSSFLFSKNLMEGMGPLTVLAVRFLLAFLVLAVLFPGKLLATKRDRLLRGMAIGAAYTAVMAAEMYGLRLLESGTCAFLEHTAVVIVPFLEAAILRRWPTRRTILASILAFGGIGLLSTVADTGSAEGYFWAFLTAGIYAGTIVLVARLARQDDPLSLGMWQVGFMGLFSLILSFALETPRLPATGGEWGAILFLALLCSCFGMAFQPIAQRVLSAAEAGIYTALNPCWACLLGIVFASENASPAKFAGSFLVLVAILLIQRAPRNEF